MNQRIKLFFATLILGLTLAAIFSSPARAEGPPVTADGGTGGTGGTTGCTG